MNVLIGGLGKELLELFLKFAEVCGKGKQRNRLVRLYEQQVPANPIATKAFHITNKLYQHLCLTLRWLYSYAHIRIDIYIFIRMLLFLFL